MLIGKRLRIWKINKGFTYGEFNNMEKLKLYTVTKASSDRTFEVGDIIWLSQNEDLNSCNGQGCLSKSEWDNPETNDFEVTACTEYYLDVTNGHEKVRKKK